MRGERRRSAAVFDSPLQVRQQQGGAFVRGGWAEAEGGGGGG
jgi:hypothetical protein